MTSPDWADFHRRHWQQQPARLAAVSPVPLDDLHALAVAASAPFRAGTRFRALPDVRFRTDHGLLRAPGDLLPGEGDATATAYRERIGSHLDGGWLLTVTQPLHLHYPSWSQVRRALEGLWRETGRPVLPVTADIAVGERYEERDALGEPSLHAHLVWVLRGSLRVRLRPEVASPPSATSASTTGGSPAVGGGAEDRTLTAAPGDLLYWPAGPRHVLHYGEQCVALHLRLPTDRRLATAEMKNQLTDAVQDGPDHDGTVPYLPFPPPVAEDGSVPAIPALRSAMAVARRTADDARFHRALRVRQAARTSAAGLEPSPAPRGADIRLVARGRHLRVAARVLRVPDGKRRALWACNGHAFAVAGEVAEQVLERLRPGTDLCVDRLCRDVGADDHDDGVLALLRKLYALRALDTSDGEQRKGGVPCPH